MRFAYGHPQVLAALHSNAEYAGHRRRHGEKEARAADLGQAVSYRFKRDEKGWRVFVTTQMMAVATTTDRGRGAIGVDLNADHLAVAETDPSGNWVRAWRVPLVTYGKSRRQAEAIIGDAVAETDPSGNWVRAWRVPLVTYGKSRRQAEAIIGDAVASVVEYAKEVGKPIVIERLDFRGKKAALEGGFRRYAWMLSSFSYGKVKAYFLSAAVGREWKFIRSTRLSVPSSAGSSSWSVTG